MEILDKKKLDELRKRAEDKLGPERNFFPETSDDDRLAALHDLQTYQIELELQNEELSRIQEELVETRDKYVDLYDFAPVGYLTISDKNMIVEANLTMADLLGEERNSLLGQPFSRFIFHEDQDIFYKHFRELIASTNRQRGCELRMLRKGGDWFWGKLECVQSAKSDKGGIRIRIVVNDITDQKRLENEIIKVKKLESTALLAGGIAHDFNNLLAVIIGNLEMMQEDMLIGRSVDQKILNAMDACLRAADLTKKFLTFSSGGEPFKKPTAVEALITESASLILAGSNVNYECSFPEGLWPVEVDAGQMTLALGNVITNAMEAMPQGGVIRIRAENVDTVSGKKRKIQGCQDAKYVKILIQDQGKGIPTDILLQVFDPYFSSQERGQKKGLGLGLTITYSIIKKHGGHIDITSQQNIGTTVSVYLPASNEQITAKECKGPKVVPLNKKILVMDDEEMLRDLTRHLLERLGYEVEVACNGEEAIQIYSNAQRADSPFGTVILDLTIKEGMGGSETIKRLQELDPDIKAIVASGYSNDPVMSNYKEHCFFGVLHKPYRMKDLEKVLENIFDSPDHQ